MTSHSDEVYRISKGGLVALSDSPAHYKAWLDEPSETTSAMMVGTAFHTAILEPEKFTKQVRLMPEINRRTNSGKEEYAKFMEQIQQDKAVAIDQEDWDTVQRMADSARKNAMLMGLLARPNGKANSMLGAIECKLEGRDEEYPNVGLKGRPDFIGDNFILDLKSMGDVPSPRQFKKTVWQYRYDMQAVVYLELARQNGMNISHFYFACVEKKKPNSIAIYEIHKDDIAKTYKEYRSLMKLLSCCVKNDHWMGLPDCITTIPIRSDTVVD